MPRVEQALGPDDIAGAGQPFGDGVAAEVHVGPAQMCEAGVPRKVRVDVLCLGQLPLHAPHGTTTSQTVSGVASNASRHTASTGSR